MPTLAIEGVWAIAAGRMGSTRMPGKTMAELAGKPSLQHIIERLRKAPSIDGVIVATTRERVDDAIARCAGGAGAAIYRGSTEDVLGRMVGAARQVAAETVVRITGDCPLTDPMIVEHVIGEYRRHNPDYASNCLHGYRYPVGIAVEVLSRELLEIADDEAVEPRDREHVTTFIYERPERFRLLGVEPPKRHRRPDLRLTLDTPEDYELISAIYDALYDTDPCFGLDAVLDYLDDHPELVELNRHVRQVSP